MVYSPIGLFVSLLAVATAVIGADVTVGTPTGPGAEDPLTTSAATPTGTITVTLDVTPSVVSSCQPLIISWIAVNLQGPTLNISYTNIGVLQTGDGATYNPSSDAKAIGIAPISQGYWAWNPVSITDPGYYVITATGNSDPPPSVKQSSPFLVTAGDTSCLSSSSSLPSTATTPPSIPSPQSSDPPVSSSSSSTPKIGAIVGGSIAAVVVVGIVIALLLYRRRRNVIAKNVNQRSVPGKGHRKWGGLASIDKIEGEIPVVVPSKSPYGNQAYNRTRSRSTGRAMTDEEGLEKGYGKDMFPVDADLLSEMPILHSNRASQRYSSDAANTALQHNSGLAAFSDGHKRRHEPKPKPATPVLSTTTATSSGTEDPFSDAAFMARGNRSSSVSVPSTARAPSRVSDISGRGAPSPLPPTTPVQSPPNSQANTIARNTSATASLGRPSRKPVPQYTDDSIELSHTTRSSPTSHTFPSRQGSGPGPSSSMADLNSSVASYDALASSAESNSHWLHDRRAPVANRNIGLAGQGEGPVHYLMPDLPPPAR